MPTEVAWGFLERAIGGSGRFVGVSVVAGAEEWSCSRTATYAGGLLYGYGYGFES